jgi:hypothetical protein
VDGFVGAHRFRAGDTATLPEAFVRALLRRGVVTETPPPSVAALQVPPPLAGSEDSTAAVEERITKPAASMSRRALKRLFGNKRKV